MLTVIDWIIFGLIFLGILIEIGYIFYKYIEMEVKDEKQK